MTRKIPPADMDNAIKAYLSGLNTEEASELFGFTAGPLVRELKARGLLRNKEERKFVRCRNISKTRMANNPFRVDEISARYLAGESVNSLAKFYNTSRSVITIRLKHAEIELRGQTTANQLRAALTPAEEHIRRAENAHAAIRGVKRTENELIQRAQTRELRPSNVSQAEILLAQWLTERGVSVIPQQAIGKYNVDLGTHPIAVEVFGGGWHFAKNHIERFDYIFNAGWHVLIVYVSGRLSVLTPGAADYIVSFLQETTANPTAPREYRMIWGEGKLYTAGSANSYELASIVPHRGRNWRRP